MNGLSRDPSREITPGQVVLARHQQVVVCRQELGYLLSFLNLLLSFERLGTQVVLLSELVVNEIKIRWQEALQTRHAQDASVQDGALGDRDEVAVAVGLTLVHAAQLH